MLGMLRKDTKFPIERLEMQKRDLVVSYWTSNFWF